MKIAKELRVFKRAMNKLGVEVDFPVQNSHYSVVIDGVDTRAHFAISTAHARGDLNGRAKLKQWLRQRGYADLLP